MHIFLTLLHLSNVLETLNKLALQQRLFLFKSNAVFKRFFSETHLQYCLTNNWCITPYRLKYSNSLNGGYFIKIGRFWNK